MSLLLTRPRNSWRSYDDKTSSGLCISPVKMGGSSEPCRFAASDTKELGGLLQGVVFLAAPCVIPFRTRWSAHALPRPRLAPHVRGRSFEPPKRDIAVVGRPNRKLIPATHAPPYSPHQPAMSKKK